MCQKSKKKKFFTCFIFLFEKGRQETAQTYVSAIYHSPFHPWMDKGGNKVFNKKKLSPKLAEKKEPLKKGYCFSSLIFKNSIHEICFVVC